MLLLQQLFVRYIPPMAKHCTHTSNTTLGSTTTCTTNQNPQQRCSCRCLANANPQGAAAHVEACAKHAGGEVGRAAGAQGQAVGGARLLLRPQLVFHRVLSQVIGLPHWREVELFLDWWCVQSQVAGA